MRRSTLGGKKDLVKVCEWLTIVGDGVWQVPVGCRTIEALLIAGGMDGQKAKIGGIFESSETGAGGNGGGSLLVKMDCTQSMITYAIGGSNQPTVFASKSALANQGASGGYAIKKGYGINGSIGFLPFNDTKLFKTRVGDGGGSGGLDAPGGSPNGGGQYYTDGGVGRYFGNGGGGGGIGGRLPTKYGTGGIGHQGCIILMYERWKISTDIVDLETGIVKINWPNNA